MRTQIILILAFISTQAAAALPVRARLSRVIDGDTVALRVEGHHEIRVRVAGIDAPELSQPYGRAAARRALSYLRGRRLWVFSEGIDRYHRVVARVCWSPTDRGYCLGYRLVREGLAYWYKRYSKDQRLAMAERYAKSKKIGVWSSISVPPWVHRKKR